MTELFDNDPQIDEHDVEGLRRHMRRLLGEKKKLQAVVRELKAPKELTARAKWIQEQVKRLSPFEPGSDEYKAAFASIEAEMQPLIDAEIAELRKADNAQLERMAAYHDRISIEQQARRLAGEICIPGYHAVFLPHITERLVVERRDGQPVFVVLGPDGKPSGATLDQLKEELRADPAFGPVLRDGVAEEATRQRKVREMLGLEGRDSQAPMKRSAFDKLSAGSQAHHVRAGGEVIDDEPSVY